MSQVNRNTKVICVADPTRLIWKGDGLVVTVGRYSVWVVETMIFVYLLVVR